MIAGRSRRLVAGTVAAVTLASTAAACGVPLEKTPRKIDRTTTSSPPADRNSLRIYLFPHDRLVGETRTVENPTIEEAVRTLLRTTPEQGRATAIPRGTKLLNLSIQEKTAVVNLSDTIGTLSRSDKRDAFAQVAFTVLCFVGREPTPESVQFEIAGKAIVPPTDFEAVKAVRKTHYKPMLWPC